MQGSKKKVDLYQMLLELLRAEEKCKHRVRDSEEEVNQLLYSSAKLKPYTKTSLQTRDIDAMLV